MLRARALWIEGLTALGLVVAPFVLPHLGFAPGTVNQILVWGLFGIGFDILFGYTGLLSFGQSAFYGAGGMIAAGEPFLARIQKHVKRLALPVPAEKTTICYAQLGTDAGFIGAAACGRQLYYRKNIVLR